MELWIKDLKSIQGDRMSCASFRVNQFRLSLFPAERRALLCALEGKKHYFWQNSCQNNSKALAAGMEIVYWHSKPLFHSKRELRN